MNLIKEAKPESLQCSKAKVYSNIRNELLRLPYFLEYYRNLGVNHFIIVDNDSNDGSLEFLKEQDDVSVYFTQESFRKSRCGLDWLNQLRDRYGVNQWCLTVDCDELIVYPFCEHLNIDQLCQYLDLWNFEGLFTLMLDFYANKPLSEYEYTAGTPFTESCNLFDSDGYFVVPVDGFPYFGIFGGARYRAFYREQSDSQGPTMRKIPLVRWKAGIRYRSVTHSTTKLRLADISGALLHFKYLYDFSGHTKSELERNDRNMNFYQAYANVVTEKPNLNLMSEVSQEYENSIQLQDLGLIRLSKIYLNWLRPYLDTKLGQGSIEVYDRVKRANGIDSRSEKINITSLTGLWDVIKPVAVSTEHGDRPFTLSVIMPAYNASQYIAKAIESVLIQPEVSELIIVEDGSSDNTLNICKKYESENELVRIYQHTGGKNKGAGESRNLGILNSGSNYIAFLDADDFYTKGRFKLTKKLFEARADIDGVYGAQGFHFYSEALKKSRLQKKQPMKISFSEYVLPEDLFCSMGPIGKSGWFHGNTLTVKREVFNRVGLFWPDRQEDVHMWLRMAIVLRLVPSDIRTPISYKGVHDNNRMSSEVIRTHRKQVLDSVIDFAIQNNAGSDQLQKLIARYYTVLKSEQGNDSNIGLATINQKLLQREDRSLIMQGLKQPSLETSSNPQKESTKPSDSVKARLKRWIKS